MLYNVIYYILYINYIGIVNKTTCMKLFCNNVQTIMYQLWFVHYSHTHNCEWVKFLFFFTDFAAKKLLYRMISSICFALFGCMEKRAHEYTANCTNIYIQSPCTLTYNTNNSLRATKTKRITRKDYQFLEFFIFFTWMDIYEEIDEA